MNPKVDAFLNNLVEWQKELELLRAIILECGLEEAYKWMHPCYTFQKKNIVLIHGFKTYCALLFYKGALLKDENNILIQQTENVQSGRQIRFTNIKEIEKLKSVIKTYIFEAIEAEKAGLKVEMKKTSEFHLPDELELKFKENPNFKDAFNSLTPGRQRGYLLYFSKAKASKTRTSRIENYEKRIFDGKGLNDCVCGLSQKKPNCDGSHKYINNK
ncbi:Uncharacterized conserved protein YdeI, YjbR/CyaY-like superfamily, DUF1801 family [Flaviramulus basaltis]|uniref:Uncharacterized conserved protein YdeI, YjbR/CyaY-like superfamily, DUF1801 family n=1 Tax=Flaviramulus basaltis TaxID=369401 RepID=A0A1K2IPV3_9FLAO|nr:DUF1801 domain-containing protein [Flaviramulus basaltis]SFZ93731.1 Uncharacterized conserved protein YdeI, YjbR/CyaY-like superfamily, DUF1801 family [Flaviramulus basaltis]